MRRTLPYLAIALILAVGSAAPRGARADDAGPFAHLLFAPELIIKNQTTIGLSAEQRQALIAEVTGAQADFLPAQMELAEKAEELGRRLEATHVDEQAAMAAASRLLELEVQIKRRHLELAIRIKNLLDESQQAKLRQLREGG